MADVKLKVFSGVVFYGSTKPSCFIFSKENTKFMFGFTACLTRHER